MSVVANGIPLTVSTTELSVTTGTSSIGNTTFSGAMTLKVDVSDLGAGDLVQFAKYEAASSSGTARRTVLGTTGPTPDGFWESDPIHVHYKGDFTAIKISGSDADLVFTLLKATIA